MFMHFMHRKIVTANLDVFVSFVRMFISITFLVKTKPKRFGAHLYMHPTFK